MADPTPTGFPAVSTPALFIADIHLAPERPDIMAAFERFCRGPARAAASVYILGDLFEVWVGDDDDDPAWEPVLQTLADLAGAGVAVHFMPGNRDFLVGEQFARATGVRLLPDHTAVRIAGDPTLLLHGDDLCTDDVDHQAFRRAVRDPEWRAGFLARPLTERRAIAARMRAASLESMTTKSATMMDVSPGAVTDVCRQWGVRRLIHGHTHRPARHEHEIDGVRVERWVLGDWFEQASILRADDAGVRATGID